MGRMTDQRNTAALDETHFPGMALTFRVMRLATLWRTRLDRALRPHGMTLAVMRPMAYLRMLSEGATQRDLAQTMNIDCSALVRVLDLLEKQNFITRQPDAQDRRAKRLFLTDLGQEQCRLFHNIAAELERDIRRALPPVQADTLTHTLSTLLEAHHAHTL
ncbi:MarR family transcriptional regulator [Acetobacter sp. LMG 32666]|uniref:MarR family winged helix-turn-helix transcriptional regulator n=1 Tax=Acetobacter sp. LMG 32666 TaxID=2959295 RepID=UPI0030C89204